MGAQFLQTSAMGRSLDTGPFVVMILLIVIGSFMALTGILLHSISTVMKTARVD